jgi:V/A-type H+/Na+-transporting ATPase subunit E
MSTEEESIQALSRAVMIEAQSETEHTLAEAREKADAIRSESQGQADADRARIMASANQEAARIRSQAVAAAQLKARTLQLEQRELLLNNVFEQAVQQIPTIQKSGTYKDVSMALLKEALAHLGSDSALIQADPGTLDLFTREVLDSISKEIGVKLELGEPFISIKQGTGLIVQTPDGHRQYDNTLETRLKRMQDALRNPVYRLLMGESL